MEKSNRYNLILAGLFLFHLSVLLYLTSTFSISYKEAIIYFDQNSVVSLLANISTYILGQNDYALRLPFIVLYFLSAIVLYLLTDDYFKKQSDRVITVSIFMVLPGVNSAALLVNESIVVIFLTLLYLYLYKLKSKENYILLTLFLFVDNSFAILFLALFLMALKKKDNFLLVYSLALFGISMSVYGFDMGGHPRGYFLDTFAIYASIFSPVLFLYFFYSIYRVGLKYEKDMFWYISVTALALSLIFSLRQKVDLQDFAPFVVVALPIMVKLFMNSIRIRLKEFRFKYYAVAFFALVMLGFNFLFFVFNKTIYILLENPKKHFAYNYHIAKELSEKLKGLGIKQIDVSDKRLQKRLKFYNIIDGSDYRLSRFKVNDDSKKISIAYHNTTVAQYYIIPIKNKSLLQN